VDLVNTQDHKSTADGKSALDAVDVNVDDDPVMTSTQAQTPKVNLTLFLHPNPRSFWWNAMFEVLAKDLTWNVDVFSKVISQSFVVSSYLSNYLK